MKRWILPETSSTLVHLLSSELAIDPLLATALAQRGIHSSSDANRFFEPTLEDLHSPFLMKDMQRAVERLDLAIQKGQRILLYGDYDVDGTASVAMMYAFLKPFYPNIDYYLPDRDKEGYGVSINGIEYAKNSTCELIIAMDCGIKANQAVDLANSYGIDFIICDHHLPEGALPNAVANLDPKRSDCHYPFKELSGCGIAFKLAQAYAYYHDTPVQELESLLDFVALSIACDIVPIVGENRTLAHFGLKKLNFEPRLGIWALINRSRRSYPLNISDLVFGLGPLINSAGRIADAREAVQLLLSSDRTSALDAATRLVERNKTRQEVDFAAVTSARIQAKHQIEECNPASIVLFNPEWHKGIIGITASRISEEFHKPTVILTESEGVAVGSARSVPGFDLYAALQSCDHLFCSFGGHAYAAGMQMPIENIPSFSSKFETFVNASITEVAKQPILEVIGEITFDQINTPFWNTLKRFAPFGPLNMTPVFVAKGVVDTGKSKRMENNHVKMCLKQGKRVFNAIGFGLADQFESCKNRPFDLAFSIREEQWRGENYLSLVVKDLH
ncbi:MAG: single-stranded-DNA-specific exonuclease RecJ [Chitinophagales bacterium]|jgi:single-stranded-DNA-specific exonuclease